MDLRIPTNHEKPIIQTMAKEYYKDQVKQESYHTKQRQFGIEIEFTLAKPTGEFSYGAAEHISNTLSSYPVVPEFGSFQIEINPPPLKVTPHNFQKLYQNIQQIRKKIESLSHEDNTQLNPIGIPFHVDPFFYNNNSYITNKQRYLISSQYFQQHNSYGATLSSHDDYIRLPGNSCLSIINELHIHLQALNIKDLLTLFNYSQMITAPFVSLGANSGITNGKKLSHNESQILLFEQAEGLYDGPATIPRVGLFPGYLKTIDEYFQNILSFTPLYYPTDELKETAFLLLESKYFGWTRIRVGSHPSSHMRIEFRPLSTQPTIIENIALAEFYIKTIELLQKNNVTFLPEKYLRINLDDSIQRGMRAELYWDLGEGIQRYLVSDILWSLLSQIENDVNIHILKNRIQNQESPTSKLINQTKKNGYSKAINHYMYCFEDEISYI